jgi:hypothetical protein
MPPNWTLEIYNRGYRCVLVLAFVSNTYTGQLSVYFVAWSSCEAHIRLSGCHLVSELEFGNANGFGTLQAVDGLNLQAPRYRLPNTWWMTYGTKKGTDGKSCMPPSKLLSAVPNTSGAIRY